MQKQAVSAVIFDLDGTIIHSEGVAAAAMVEVFAKHGMALDGSHAEAVTGRTWEAAFRILEGMIRLPARSDLLLAEVLQEYRVRLRTQVQPVPGATSAIRALSADFRLALVSGSYREEIETALAGLGVLEHFEFYLGAEDYAASKPSPEGYEAAMKRLGVVPGEVVIFEDSEAGIAAGIAAGARVVAVQHCGSLPPGSPWLSRAAARVGDLGQVSPDWIRRL